MTAGRVTCQANWGFCVKQGRWIVVILGLLCVSLASVVPQLDVPDTAFNETDAPVNVTTPVVAQTNFAVPTAHPVIIPRKQLAWWSPSTMMHGIAPKPRMRASHSLLNLLCRLLC